MLLNLVVPSISTLSSLLTKQFTFDDYAGMLFFYMLALYAELSVLKPSQDICNKRGQHRACVRAFARELGARNRQGKIGHLDRNFIM